MANSKILRPIEAPKHQIHLHKQMLDQIIKFQSIIAFRIKIEGVL